MEERKTKVMVVDDEPDILEVLQHSLALHGFEVTGVLNGNQALALLEKHHADLILLDLVMPGRTGNEVARIVKCRYPDTKIVVVTGYPSQAEDLQRNNLLEGCFIKPVDLNVLQKAVESLLDTTGPEPPRPVRVITIKAKALCIMTNPDEAYFLKTQLKQHFVKSPWFFFGIACGEKDLTQKLTSLAPDIVVVDESYGAKVNTHILEDIRRYAPHAQEVIVSNLTAAVYDFYAQAKLMETLRSLCVAHGLFEITLTRP